MVRVESITKRFGGVVANREVTFTVEEGQSGGGMGPEGGAGGGQVIATGTPEKIVKNKASDTAQHLAKLL
mgnify:CR=1 FL=1